MGSDKVGPRWLHTRFTVVRRGDKKSSVAGAAYNSRSALRDERTGELHDFRRAHQHERVVADLGVSLPEGAPERWRERAALWNEVERVERKSDAQLCRRGDLSLPDALSDEESVALARAIVADRVAEGHVVDAVIHRGRDGRNTHLHIQEPLRRCDERGFLPKSVNEYLVRNPETREERMATASEFRGLRGEGFEKVYRYRKGDAWRELTPSEAEGWERCARHSKTPVQRTRYLNGDWNDAGKAREWRDDIAARTNEALELHYERARTPRPDRVYVDPRSYEEQGQDELPQLHEGGRARGEEERERRRCEGEGREYEPVTGIAMENRRRRELNEAARSVERAAELMTAARADAREWADAWVEENLSEEALLWYEAMERDRDDDAGSRGAGGGYSLASLVGESRSASMALSGDEGASRAQRIAHRAAGAIRELTDAALGAVLSVMGARWPEFARAVRDAAAEAPATARARRAPIDDDLDGISDELGRASSLARLGDAPRTRRERSWGEAPPRLVAVGTEGYEARKREFLGRLESAFRRYRAYCEEHEGTPFERFREFNGAIPEELRRDREVRARVSARIRDADELRCRYASGVPAALRPASRASCSESSPARDAVPLERERSRGGGAR